MTELTYQPPSEIANIKKRLFLLAFARHGQIEQACAAAGLSRRSYYNWRRDDPQFVVAAQDAKDFCADTLEAEADRRAVKGTPRLKFHKGKPVIDPDTGQPYVEHEYSDTLLMFRLKALRPEMYREHYRVKVSDERMNAEANRILALVNGQANGNGHAAE